MENNLLNRLTKLFIYLMLVSCGSELTDAQSIIDKSIGMHGGDLYENSIVEFDFRDRHYIFERNNGVYSYHRIFNDSTGIYHDILTNDGFKRMLNEKELKVEKEWAVRYSNSINSVAYFSYLPFGLNDPAVNKKLIGEEEIGDNLYYKIMVTFDQEGGGEDHEDVFVYWINKDNFRMEYFGYSYITDGGGTRFRKATNTRENNGLLYSDYINYQGPSEFTNVSKLGALYKEGELDELSEIIIENLIVKRSR